MSFFTSATIIVGTAPLIVTGVMLVLIAFPGLLVSPIAGLIAWRLARGRLLSGGREALAGVAYSICLFLPWVLLVVALRKGSLSSSTVNKSYMLLYLAWLIGPLITVGITGAYFPSLVSDPRPEYWWVSLGVFSGMVILWVGSAGMTRKWWNGVEDVTVDCLISIRFILPYALACVCLWTFYLFAQSGIGIEDACSEQQAVLAGCPP